jgi:transcriptional regulator with XRE-family HTH domain
MATPKRLPTTRKRLPQQVTAHLDAERDALAAIAAGEDRTDAVVEHADAAMRAAWAHAEANEPPKRGLANVECTTSFESIIADRLKETRIEAGWTQVRLAEAMAPYSTWTRFTVAEIETGRRSVSLEELVVLASLFAEPVVRFLVPKDRRTYLDLPTTDVAPSVLVELLIGQGGVIGTGGRTWAAAARVANQGGPRPAPDLWAARATASRSRTS